MELKELQATLANIEDARPFEDLTVCVTVPSRQLLTTDWRCLQAEEVGDAHPEIRKAVETMVSKGKWTVPGMCSVLPVYHHVLTRCIGYREKFGEMSLM